MRRQATRCGGSVAHAGAKRVSSLHGERREAARADEDGAIEGQLKSALKPSLNP